MAPQKVVLRGTSEDPDAELELGPFSQGLAVTNDGKALTDVASSKLVATWLICGSGWFGVNAPVGKQGAFRDVFIQTYQSDSPSHDDGLTVRRRDQTYSDVYEGDEQVLWARHAEAELYVAARRAGYDHDDAGSHVAHVWKRATA